MHAVLRRCPPSWPCWALAFALLLKAALPLLAAASASAQQRPLAEVCSVYGVATAASAQHGGQSAFGHSGTPAAHHGEVPAAHHVDVCPLLALAAFGITSGASATAPSAPVGLGDPRAASMAAPHRFDAAARWATRLKHGPPASA